jgi:hypothetical protein
MIDDYAVLRDAILQRRLVSCSYAGLVRVLCPYALGEKHGIPHLLAWQFGGRSWGRVPGWHCMPVQEMSQVIVYDGQWRSGMPAAPDELRLESVDVEAGPQKSA